VDGSAEPPPPHAVSAAAHSVATAAILMDMFNGGRLSG
jgi:hypothetical protein